MPKHAVHSGKSCASLSPLPLKSIAAAASQIAALRLWLCLVDVDGPSANIFSIQGSHGFFCLCIIWHFDETETADTARIAIGGKRDALNRSEGLKHGTEFAFSHVVCEIADKDLFHGFPLSS